MKKMLSLFKKHPGIWLVVLLLVIPFVVTNKYYMHLVNTVLILSILTAGLNILTGYCGQISIGHAAFYGIGAYASAILTVKLGLSFWLALPLSGLITGLLGYVIGKHTLKLSGSYMAIASIGIGEITRLVLINWTELTGGAEGFKNIPSPTFFGIALDNDLSYYWLIMPIVILIYFMYTNYVRSEVGRAYKAVNQEEIAAGFMGINTSSMKVQAFVISTVLAGIAGSLNAHLNGYLSPYTYNFTQSVSYLMMVLAGGMGFILGPVVGVLLLTFAKEMFRFFNDYQLIIYGIMLVIVIIFMPRGICGAVMGGFKRLQSFCKARKDKKAQGVLTAARKEK